MGKKRLKREEKEKSISFLKILSYTYLGDITY